MRTARDALAVRSTDESLIFLGQALWPRTYGQGLGDKEAWDYCVERAIEGSPTSAQASEQDACAASMVWANQYAFAVKWADSGYPKLVTGHKYAAALMATRIDQEFIGDIHLPGKGFLVAIPRGILTVPFEGGSSIPEDDRGFIRDYDRIGVATYEAHGKTRATMVLLDADTHGGILQCVVAETIEDLLFRDLDTAEEGYSEAFTITDVDRKKRSIVLARRLVVGLLLAMRDTANFKEQSHPSRKRGDGREEPAHRIVFVGKPITVDCRPAIASYLGGHRGPPSVQTLVRGHHKRQVVGSDRKGRRIIWIEPYWRGPEDAPILARPHHIGPK